MKTSIHTQDGNVHIHRVQDVEPVLQSAAARRQAGAIGSNEMRHAAQFPMVIVEAYLNDNNITLAEFMKNQEHVKRMLSDPALAHFRIWEGKV